MRTRVMQDEPDDAGAAVAAAPRALREAQRGGGGRVAGGAVAAAIGLAALSGGGALVGVHATQRDGDGFYATDPAALATSTRALVSEDVDGDLDGVTRLLDDGRLGDLRLSATAARDGPVFVGVGPRDDVEAYLRGVPRATADFGDAAVPPRATAGARAPAAPSAQRFWSRSASGPGRQTIVWPLESGDWSAVVMNADGSAGVAVESELGVRTDGVLWLGIAALAVGGGLAALGTALIVTGRRRARTGGRDDP